MNYYKFNKREQEKVKARLFEAYYECRRSKRNAYNTLVFELNQEEEISQLHEDILSHNYAIGRSQAFIVFEPVKREIFAADFRDRVIHHYIIARLNPIFEKLFIYDSYSCREGKGTHFGVKRVDGFIRSCSQNYTQDCWVLKVDIQGFFMNIRKEILLKKVLTVIEKHYHDFDKELLIKLCSATILHNPVPGCVIKGDKSNWDGLPESKSLFRTNGVVGLPIGNLTSQIFANLYLNDFDHFVKRELRLKHYGRYVDDCILIHKNKDELMTMKQRIGDYLKSELGLCLHPRKIYLQHFAKGVLFIGVFIKPFRKYVGRRVSKKLNKTMINDYKKCFVDNDDNVVQNIRKWMDSANSYLGICKHYDTYRYRKTLTTYYVSESVRFDKELCVVCLN